MDFSNDIMLKRFYKEYVNICELYSKGSIDDFTAVSEIKTIQETVGIYMTGLFELERRKKGGE